MLSDLIDLDSAIFDLISKCSDNYIFIGNIKSGHYHWSKNMLLDFALENELTEDPDVWINLLHPEDYPLLEEAFREMESRKKKQFCLELRFKKKDQDYTWVRCDNWVMEDKENTGTIFAGVATNKMTNSTLDPVTNLRCNYDFRFMLSAITQKEMTCGVMVLGVDDFKRVNDLYSYAYGDEVLRVFARKMKEMLPEGVSLYRLDGDGFGILYPNASKEDMLQCFSQLKKIAEMPIYLEESTISFTVSAGICLYPKDGTSSEMLYRNARVSLRTSKARGKNQATAYSDELFEKEQFKMRLFEKLKECIIDHFHGFTLNFQPLIDARTKTLSGCEVLLRWSHPDFPDGVTPYEFIPVLEKSGLIIETGKWVLETAVCQLVDWIEYMPEFQMNINVTSGQFEDPDFKFFVMETLSKYKIDPSLITLELTESGKITKTKEVQHAFDFLRSQGIKIAFDDFGTGYASLSIFQVLSADELKIDRSFLERITYDVTDQKILSQIINLCHSMNMTVCVEGIETKEVDKIICQLGPELLQGYYYNKPLTKEDFFSYYFHKSETKEKHELLTIVPQYKKSMVYSDFRPTQPLSMEEVIDNAYAGIFQVALDHEFTFLTCNEGYRRMLGYTAREMEEKFGNRALGFVHPDDMAFINEEIRRQLGYGDTVTIEFRVVRSDGSAIWILGTGNVVKGRHGNSNLIVVIIENDKIKKKQLAVEQNYEFYKKILKNVPIGMKCVRYDEEFTIEYISPGLLAILGYKEEEIKSLFDGKLRNMIYKEDRNQVISSILEQLPKSKVVVLHYRMLCKDGKLIWVETISRIYEADADGIQRCYSSVMDITDNTEKQSEGRFLSIENRYQTAAQEWGEVLFEYNFQTRCVIFSDNYQSMFGRAPKRRIDEEIYSIHEADRDILLNTLQTVHEGRQPHPIEVRILVRKEEYIWCSLVFTKPDKIGNVPVAAIGKISNIDEEKRKRDKLLAQTQHDNMTGLLNKSTVEERIRHTLSHAEEGQYYAMFMIDVDNFKKVNDSMGHMFGDMVLREVAVRILSQFRKSDITGRAGGDEFLAFIEFNGDLRFLERKGQEIVNALQKKIVYQGVTIQVSISLGISYYPTDGTHFHELFRRADSALYRAKEIGKNGFCISGI